MAVIQWTIGILFGIGWLLIALTNDWLAWRQYVRKEKKAPSCIPVIGIMSAYFSLRILSIGHPVPYHGLLLLLALLLDFGSIGAVVAMIVYPFFRLREKEEKNHGSSGAD